MDRLLMSLIICLLFALNVANATEDAYLFDNDQQRQQYQQLIETLRCLVCQNQNLADSNAALAQDLRQEVYELIIKGETAEQIQQYLVDRYGDFILYQPPVNRMTLLLWFGPFIVLLIAFSTVIYRIKKQKKINDSQSALSEQQQKQINRLLNDK